ncbi:predicted protein [Plenodomus lingam JN3]|uniref:Predicted protein n=1 Tax=Leptosphaeria maculans (strain JN3 / isolate v23.1.3 / race Av1-4-5-6-7-8) TaxID=985895 RepID=E5A8I5_LEPMJ|nr:predicted protein [Plenodomus lingam JN3]CBX99930.1 predicted protein [Plenodomus lingam JN3]
MSTLLKNSQELPATSMAPIHQNQYGDRVQRRKFRNVFGPQCSVFAYLKHPASLVPALTGKASNPMMTCPHLQLRLVRAFQGRQQCCGGYGGTAERHRTTSVPEARRPYLDRAIIRLRLLYSALISAARCRGTRLSETTGWTHRLPGINSRGWEKQFRKMVKLDSLIIKALNTSGALAREFPPILPTSSTTSDPTSSAQSCPDSEPKHTSGSQRLSQLFPSRPNSLISPISPASSSSYRRSYPSPLVPAAEPPYRIPRAPAPPLFHEDTASSPVACSYDHQSVSHTLQSKSGTKRLFSRLASLRAGGLRVNTYGRLGDEEAASSKRQLPGMQEAEESVGHDLSSYEGLPLRSFQPRIRGEHPLEVKREQDLHEAAHAAEFERLESQLGAGMTTILQKPFTHNPIRPPHESSGTLQRGFSVSEMAHLQAKDAQKEADTKGDIVAVAEIPIDISDSIAGTDFDRRSSIMTADTSLAGKDAQTSYFFPHDPDMPSWRPFTMGWPWIAMLITVALVLSGLQEFLCQWSMGHVKAHSEEGILRFGKVGDLTVGLYFAWQYAPIMIFVLYGILWQMTDFEVKRLEPFYQLSQKTGATAGESLNMDYLTFMSWAVPLRALRHKQYAVIYSSMGTMIASSVVPVLQAASIKMEQIEESEQGQPQKVVRVVPPWSRAVSGCLLIVAFCGAMLMYAMRRKSGLQSDPKGIAGIAAMATKSHILADFHGLDKAPLHKIHKQLRHRRYILHKSSMWQGEYIRNSKDKVPETGTDPRPLMLRKRFGFAFITFIIAVAIATPIFTFVERAAAITLKLPFLMTGLATIIRMLWNTLNTDVRMLQPFWILAHRHAPPKTLTLDYAGTNPLFLPFQAFFNRHYLVALVALGSILAEILTVCVSSISVDGKKFIPGLGRIHDNDVSSANNTVHNTDPDDHYNTDQTYRSFWSSFTLSILILIYLVVTALITYTTRSQKLLPRQIGSLASVLAFIHQSKMLASGAGR